MVECSSSLISSGVIGFLRSVAMVSVGYISILRSGMNFSPLLFRSFPFQRLFYRLMRFRTLIKLHGFVK